MTYQYGKPLLRVYLGDQPLFPSDDSVCGEPWEPLKPGPNTVLWRYFSFAKFCSLLERQELFFALVSDMEDRYEGFVSHPMPREPGDRLQQAELLTREVLHEIARSALISCWTEAGHESSLMWTSYAREEGVAIRTSFHDLQESLHVIDAELPVTFGRVKYINYGQQQVPRFGWAPLFHKRQEYRGEDEVRAVLPGPPWEPRFDSDKQEGAVVDISLDSDVAEQRGRYIPVNLGILVKEVVVSPHAASWFVQLVQSVVDRSRVKASVTLSSLSTL